jgi:mono/diheme cytochrome c family protein
MISRSERWCRRALAGAFTLAAGCAGSTSELPQLAYSTVGDTTALLARGEYIVRSVAVCGSCHAENPRQNRDGPLSGGMAFRSWRLGTLRAANITPDSATGIGAWSEAELVRAIRNGVDRDGEVLAPVMPYEWFHEMSDRDAFAVARYLKSQPAVVHDVRNNTNLVFALAESLFLHPESNGDPVLGPQRAATAEYGQYLANHVALCAECHTPRHGLMDAPDHSRLFAGDARPPKGFPANPANLTPDSTGIGAWTEDQFITTLRTGVDPQGDTLHAFMPWHQFRRMATEDLRAIYRYLRRVPPIRNEVPEREPGS